MLAVLFWCLRCVVAKPIAKKGKSVAVLQLASENATRHSVRGCV